MAALKHVLRRYWSVVVAAAVLVVHARLYNFVCDDAYVSFRYAKNLVDHGVLEFNVGERVEGYTNFLWTLLVAAGMALRVGPVASSKFLGVAFAVGTLALLVRMTLTLDRGKPRLAHAVAPLLLASMSAFGCWASGGLETSLFTFLVLWGIARLLEEHAQGHGARSGLIFALVALTRPEGPLIFAVAFAARLGAWWRARHTTAAPSFARFVLGFAGLFAALWLPYFVWRFAYYGHPFPNTYYVKTGAQHTFGPGLFYWRRFVEDHAAAFLPFIFLAGWPARGDSARRRLFAFGLAFSLVYAAYVISIGGDFLGLYRFVLPVLVVLVLLFVESMRRIATRLAPVVPRPVLALAGVLMLGGHLFAVRTTTNQARTVLKDDNGIDPPAFLEVYARDRIPVGRWLAKHARPDDLATVGGAGIIPYYSGLRSFDIFGLVDAGIAHDPKAIVSNRPGHQRWGTDRYVLGRKPTIITHLYGIYYPYKSTPAEDDYWAGFGYEWVTASIPGLAYEPYNQYSFLKRIDRAFGPFPARPLTTPQRTPTDGISIQGGPAR